MMHRCRECTLLRVRQEGDTCWECCSNGAAVNAVPLASSGASWFWYHTNGRTMASTDPGMTVAFPWRQGYYSVPYGRVDISGNPQDYGYTLKTDQGSNGFQYHPPAPGWRERLASAPRYSTSFGFITYDQVSYPPAPTDADEYWPRMTAT